MGLIKKYYQKAIVFILLLISISFFAVAFIAKPQRTSAQEIYNFNTESKLTNITFPYSQTIPITTKNIEYMEVLFGDDSINQYVYTISASKDNHTFFEHTYVDETSNIIRIPLSEVEFQPNDMLTIDISCDHSCNHAKFKLYDTDSGPSLKIAIISHSSDYRFIWFGLFFLSVGLTLIPLIKEGKR